jgi:2,3,4,5-tetrahydropyridine-2-carboxylate N-succinyltransferase
MLQQTIENIWDNRELLKEEESQKSIREVIRQLDLGELRVAEPTENGWKVNEWVKKAVVMYFPIQKMETIEVGPFEFHDKMPLKRNYAEKGVRVVPHAVAREGAFIASGVILMPSYVNIGAYGGYLGDSWKLCTNREKRSLERWSRNWRSFGATSGSTRNYRR